MSLTHEDFMKLENGSDIRGVAVPGVPDEPVTLTPEAANRIAMGFVRLLIEKTGKQGAELRIAVGHDSRISALALKDCVLTGLTHAGATACSPPPPPCSWRPSSRKRWQTAPS